MLQDVPLDDGLVLRLHHEGGLFDTETEVVILLHDDGEDDILRGEDIFIVVRAHRIQHQPVTLDMHITRLDVGVHQQEHSLHVLKNVNQTNIYILQVSLTNQLSQQPGREHIQTRLFRHLELQLPMYILLHVLQQRDTDLNLLDLHDFTLRSRLLLLVHVLLEVTYTSLPYIHF